MKNDPFLVIELKQPAIVDRASGLILCTFKHWHRDLTAAQALRAYLTNGGNCPPPKDYAGGRFYGDLVAAKTVSRAALRAFYNL